MRKWLLGQSSEARKTSNRRSAVDLSFGLHALSRWSNKSWAGFFCGGILCQYGIRGNVQGAAYAQYCFQTHVYLSPFDVGIGAVRKACGLRKLRLCHPHVLSKGIESVANGVQVIDQHYCSSKIYLFGIIVPKTLA